MKLGEVTTAVTPPTYNNTVHAETLIQRVVMILNDLLITTPRSRDEAAMNHFIKNCF